MYGLTRATLTLIGAGGAGFLIWLGSTIAGDNPSAGEFWAFAGIVAAAGLVLALSQLLGGWTKWGWPRISLSVLLVGFLPTLVAAGWIILYAQPSANWFQRHISSWSSDIGISGLVQDMARASVVLAFGLGLVFGFIFDTTGPKTDEALVREPSAAAPPAPAAPPRADDTAATRVDGPADTTATRERGPEP